MSAALYSDQEWRVLLRDCGVQPATTAAWAPVFSRTVKMGTFSAGRADLIDFLGQILVESGFLNHMVENLDYSALRLTQVWPSRFPTQESAAPFERNQRALANKVYGGRMGNILPDDGWTFRGRSPIQITGRSNYALVGVLMGQDLLTMPELLEQPHFALEACIAWWESRIPDSMLGDPEKVTRRVNGGLHGLAEREHLTGLAAKAFA